MTRLNHVESFVPARAQSSRLPRKLLVDLEGWLVLTYALQRRTQPQLSWRHMFCTTACSEDLEIAEIGEANGWAVLRGASEAGRNCG